MAVDPKLYPCIKGTTDSEIIFFLALTFGLQDDPLAAVERMTGFVEKTGRAHSIEHPIHMTLGISDGTRIWAVRYSTEGKSSTLFHSRSVQALRELNPEIGLSDDARAVVSEPLSDLTAFWVEIPESTAILVEKGEVTTRAFEPRPPSA
jgi:glutamine amidotransferase